MSRKIKNKPSPSVGETVALAPPEPVFQLGEAAQAAQERHDAHIRMLLERMGCEVVEPATPRSE